MPVEYLAAGLSLKVDIDEHEIRELYLFPNMKVYYR